ncbi:hypothetical protein TNCT1_04940 [Streptomyces sp. 1-11]|nr:hypothetical protein TNCT1_04940 [Streptomyces sp. 1-11]
MEGAEPASGTAGAGTAAREDEEAGMVPPNLIDKPSIIAIPFVKVPIAVSWDRRSLAESREMLG